MEVLPFNVAESSNDSWQRHDLHRDQPGVRFFRRWLQHYEAEKRNFGSQPGWDAMLDRHKKTQMLY